MARRSSLNDRLTAVLSQSCNRRNVTRSIAAAALAISLTVVVPLTMLRAADEMPSEGRPADETADQDGTASQGAAASDPDKQTASPKRRPELDDADDKAVTPKPAQTLSEEITRKIKWGEPVNGLRAAVIILSVVDVPQDMMLVVQNVSDAEIRIDDSAESNEHSLYIKLDGELQAGMGAHKPNFGDMRLQPREVAMVPAFPPTPPGPPVASK